MRLRNLTGLAVAAICATAAATPARSQTEVHYQYGTFDNPFAGTSAATTILTVQHASLWQYGDNFYFIDFSDDGGSDGFNEMDAYGEFYANFSLGKLTGRDLGFGPVADFGVFAGAGIGTDSNFLQWLPGLRASWNLPGFVFLNTDFALALDGGRGHAGGSPPEMESLLIIDVNGLLAFSVGSQSFQIAGHAQYATATTDELGNEVPASILAQPQLRWDIGGANGLFVGIEYHYWSNKLGTDVDESVVQLLGVWQL